MCCYGLFIRINEEHICFLQCDCDSDLLEILITEREVSNTNCEMETISAAKGWVTREAEAAFVDLMNVGNQR